MFFSVLKGWGSRFWYERIGVRGFGAGVDRGSRFWFWGGLGFKVLALGWIGVRGFGPGVDWGSRFWCWGARKQRKNTRKVLPRATKGGGAPLKTRAKHEFLQFIRVFTRFWPSGWRGVQRERGVGGIG